MAASSPFPCEQALAQTSVWLTWRELGYGTATHEALQLTSSAAQPARQAWVGEVLMGGAAEVMTVVLSGPAEESVEDWARARENRGRRAMVTRILMVGKEGGGLRVVG